MKLTTLHIEYFLKVIGFIAVMLILMQLVGCSSTCALTEPHHNDYMVAWCNEKEVWVFERGKNDSLVLRDKPIRNNGQIYYAGDFIILEDEYRYFPDF